MRRYQSASSRFSQPDPYYGSYNLTDPQSLNRYAYTQNDPVNFVDPSGLSMAYTNCYLVLDAGDGSFAFGIFYQHWVCVTENSGGSGGGYGSGIRRNRPSSPEPENEPKCKQDKTGGDRDDILDLLGRAGLSDGITNIQSAGPKP
jgi:hypothetical protein